jgi:hypothetical protein
MTEKLPARLGGKYSDEEIHRFLLALAYQGGRLYTTIDFLKGEGGEVPNYRTLKKWRDETHADQYLEIRERTAARREKLLIDKIEPAIERALEVTMLALDKSEEELKQDRAKDPAATGRNAATILGILVDKKFGYEGRPTAQVVHLNGDQILRKLAQRGRVAEQADVESTAASGDEIADAQVVEPPGEEES